MTRIKYTPEQERFIAEALNTIDENPVSRLSKITRKTLDNSNFVVDAHAHIFDGKCIDPTYFVIRSIGIENSPMLVNLVEYLMGEFLGKDQTEEKGMTPDFLLTVDECVDKIYNGEIQITESDIHSFFKEVEKKQVKESENKSIEDVDLRHIKQRIQYVIGILKTGKMEDVYHAFHDTYSIQNVEKGKELVAVILGMDIESGWNNSIIKNYQTQTDELAALAQDYPVIPFLPLHPNRAKQKGENFNELYDTFLRVFKKEDPKFFGVKIYPSLGYLPSDEVLQPIFEVCRLRNIPVVTHCGGEMVSTFEKVIEVNRFGVKNQITGTRKERARQLNEPEEWRAVLEEHEGLRLNLGHFGGDRAWANPHDDNAHRLQTIFDLMDQYQVFTDFSFNLNDYEASRAFSEQLHKNDARSEMILKRCMFGTDFWVVIPMSNLLEDQQRFLEFVDDKKEALLKDNVMQFLGLESLIETT